MTKLIPLLLAVALTGCVDSQTAHQMTRELQRIQQNQIPSTYDYDPYPDPRNSGNYGTPSTNRYACDAEDRFRNPAAYRRCKAGGG